jgi:nucleotide-binding universal stress UspA family protein
MAQVRRIIYASDFSRASRPAFARAVELARATRAELIVMHVLVPVVPPVMTDGAYLPPRMWDELEAGVRASAKKQLDRLLEKARSAGIRASSLLAAGVAAEQIARVAKGKRADLLVLGTHGRTGFAKVVLGSVAARLVATAPCPVLTVRGR